MSNSTYTRKNIIEQCEIAIGNPTLFYTQKFVNYRGKTSDTKEYYTEVVAEFLYNNRSKFVIPTILRKNCYKIDAHNGVIADTNSPRAEEIMAKVMFNGKKFLDDGRILDYQIPLKNTQKNKAGKIDLLALQDSTKSVFVLELKKTDSKESLLRCVLESYTYLCQVNKERLLKDYSVHNDYSLVATPLVFNNGIQMNEFMDSSRKFVHKLIDIWQIKPVSYETAYSFKGIC